MVRKKIAEATAAEQARKAFAEFKYLTSSRGFIVSKISALFKPSNAKKKKGRNTFWKPDCTKENVYQKLMNHLIIMKERYPQTDGYLCHYCKQPWTFKVNYGVRGTGHRKRKDRDPGTDKNFSIDRWDPLITYTYDNIRFCCLGCNNRKGESTTLDSKNFQEAKNDLR